jgi:hypothetical protein
MARNSLKRDVGPELLEGLRELKRCEVGSVVTVPSVATFREVRR